MGDVDFSRAQWRKSSHSNEQGECVEVASVRSIVAMRDSKNPNQPGLTLTLAEWRAFVDTVKRTGRDSTTR